MSLLRHWPRMAIGRYIHSSAPSLNIGSGPPNSNIPQRLQEQIEEDKQRLQWRTPYSERKDSFYSAFKLFASHNRNAELIEVMQQPIDFSPSVLLQWWRKRRAGVEAHMQKFIPERHAILGNDLATAHFLVHRGGSVRFRGRKDWIQMDKNEEYDLPQQYVANMTLEEVRCDGMHLFYEGLENIRRLPHLKTLSFENVDLFDDWYMDRISGNQFPSLEVLNLRGTSVSHRGLNCLYRLPSLRRVLVDNPEKDVMWKLTVTMLEEWNPKMQITQSA